MKIVLTLDKRHNEEESNELSPSTSPFSGQCMCRDRRDGAKRKDNKFYDFQLKTATHLATRILGT